MFVGATALALGYELFKSWVDANPVADPAVAQNEPIKQGASGPKTYDHA
jgi:hypothetical protein